MEGLEQRHIFRNQQAAGSTPAGGSRNFKKTKVPQEPSAPTSLICCAEATACSTGSEFCRRLSGVVDPAKVNRRNIGCGSDLNLKEKTTMQFLLLLYENEQRWSQGYPQSEMSEYREFGKEFAKAIKGGNALQPTRTAATVRVRDGNQLATDGPFAETKEQLGGFYLIEAKDRDEAIAMAAKIPSARFGGVEVRPIMTFS
jgi:hypothetical protein